MNLVNVSDLNVGVKCQRPFFVFLSLSRNFFKKETSDIYLIFTSISSCLVLYLLLQGEKKRESADGVLRSGAVRHDERRAGGPFLCGNSRHTMNFLSFLLRHHHKKKVVGGGEKKENILPRGPPENVHLAGLMDIYCHFSCSTNPGTS